MRYIVTAIAIIGLIISIIISYNDFVEEKKQEVIDRKLLKEEIKLELMQELKNV